METLSDIEPIDNPTALKIIDAAAQLFLQRGYTAVSVNDIVRAAAVTKPTLYYYFADKEELFLHTGLRVLATMGAEMDTTLQQAGAIPAQLHALAHTLLRDNDRDMRMMRHEMFEHLGPSPRARLARAFYQRLFAPVVALMQRGLDDGTLGRYPAPILATMFLGLSDAFLEHGSAAARADWESSSSTMPQLPPLGPEHMVDLFLNGVAAA